jgi:hypothetical protein
MSNKMKYKHKTRITGHRKARCLADVSQKVAQIG